MHISSVRLDSTCVLVLPSSQLILQQHLQIGTARLWGSLTTLTLQIGSGASRTRGQSGSASATRQRQACFMFAIPTGEIRYATPGEPQQPTDIPAVWLSAPWIQRETASDIQSGA